MEELQTPGEELSGTAPESAAAPAAAGADMGEAAPGTAGTAAPVTAAPGKAPDTEAKAPDPAAATAPVSTNGPADNADPVPGLTEAQSAFIRADLERFRKECPEVDLCALETDPSFRRFCGSRLYREPAVELYKDYRALREESGRAAEERLRAKEGRATGSGSSGTGSNLTARERAALQEWNESYPRLRMTEKEWTARGRL